MPPKNKKGESGARKRKTRSDIEKETAKEHDGTSSEEKEKNDSQELSSKNPHTKKRCILFCKGKKMTFKSSQIKRNLTNR